MNYMICVTILSATHGLLPPSQGLTRSHILLAETVSIDSVIADLADVRSSAETEIACASTTQDVEEARRKWLSKKGPVNAAMSQMRSLRPAEKPRLGAVVNDVKAALEEAILSRRSALEQAELDERVAADTIDVTLPGLPFREVGVRHPLSLMMDKAVDTFRGLGYDAITDPADSPEIEDDYYCFEALNCPPDHPARDMQDTFYLPGDLLLRTHTSAVQIRQMEKRKPPFRILERHRTVPNGARSNSVQIPGWLTFPPTRPPRTVVSPGRVYRRDAIDATHSMVFHQVEILALDEIGELNLGHLKGTVEHFLQAC